MPSIKNVRLFTSYVEVCLFLPESCPKHWFPCWTPWERIGTRVAHCQWYFKCFLNLFAFLLNFSALRDYDFHYFVFEVGVVLCPNWEFIFLIRFLISFFRSCFPALGSVKLEKFFTPYSLPIIVEVSAEAVLKFVESLGIEGSLHLLEYPHNPILRMGYFHEEGQVLSFRLTRYHSCDWFSHPPKPPGQYTDLNQY